MKAPSVPPPKRLDTAGMSGEDTMKPIGVIAADSPIMPGDTPCRCRMKESSG